MAGAHYTSAQIDELPMQDATALLSYWSERPPTHELLAAIYRVEARPKPSVEDPSGIGALIARHPNGQI
jgi:hypothetical protein